MAEQTGSAPEGRQTLEDIAASRPRGFPWPPLILIGIVVLASVVAIAARSLGGEEAGPKVLTDTSFMTTANELCRTAFPPLRPVATDRDDVVGTKEIAEQSRKAADGLEALADRLGEVPVSGRDSPFVVGWLNDWTTFVDTGRRYAKVLDTGDVRSANKEATAGDQAQQRADRFARANGLEECQLRAVFVAPPRRSPL